MPEASKPATKAARKPAAKPSTRPKAAAKRKPAPKRAPVVKPASEFATQAQETGRSVFLAGLGIYGKAYDQAQERLSTLQKRVQQRRKKADSLYRELVKRGERVEKEAKGAIRELELPKLELDTLTDRKKLEQQLKKAKTRLQGLKGSVGFKSAA